MKRATRIILTRAGEVSASPFEIRAAAILFAVNGRQAAIQYLDGCRRHFQNAAQVRAFLRGRGWSRRSQRGTRICRAIGDVLDLRVTMPRVPLDTRIHRDALARVQALQALFAGRNVRVCLDVEYRKR